MSALPEWFVVAQLPQARPRGGANAKCRACRGCSAKPNGEPFANLIEVDQFVVGVLYSRIITSKQGDSQCVGSSVGASQLRKVLPSLDPVTLGIGDQDSVLVCDSKVDLTAGNHKMC